ncbi:MmyB family transcriptional regulator [Teichococcus vastitatis]|uniref:MmyB family transcriptional regulator n=1 Tax=Teichococcus vastitatis TaxID=2307076 RepID=UPI0013005040|nr:transcriptional regulator [Pseudoroseomonas vastitatis]
MLNDVEREHLFLLGLGRLPGVRYRPSDDVTPRLQRVLDAMASSPALLSTVTWDVVAWNAAAAAVLTDYAKLPAAKRNVLRLVFLDPGSRAMNQDWESVARFVVAVFRAGIPRAGAQAAVEPLVRELRGDSPDFVRIWDEGGVAGFGDGIKHLRRPIHGEIALEYSAFAVDGRPDLTMLVFTPNRREDADRIRTLIVPA